MRTVNPQRHAEREQQIREGAAMAFAQTGYANTTVAALRRATGLSSGALFHYYADKAAIFRAVVEAGCQEQRDRLAAIDTVDTEAAFWEVVDVLADDLAGLYAAGMTVAILERVGADPELATILAEQESVVLLLLTDLLTRLRQHDQLDPQLRPAEVARWIVAMIDGLILHAADDEADPVADTAFLTMSLRRTLGLGSDA